MEESEKLYKLYGYRLCSNKTPPKQKPPSKVFTTSILGTWKSWWWYVVSERLGSFRQLSLNVFKVGILVGYLFDIRVVSSLGIFGFLWVLFIIIIIIIFDFLISLVSFSYLFWSGGDFFNSKSAVTTAVWPPFDGREFFVSQNLWVIVRGPP